MRAQLNLRQQLIKQRLAIERSVRSVLFSNGIKPQRTHHARGLSPAVEAALSLASTDVRTALSGEVMPLLAVCDSIRS